MNAELFDDTGPSRDPSLAELLRGKDVTLEIGYGMAPLFTYYADRFKGDGVYVGLDKSLPSNVPSNVNIAKLQGIPLTNIYTLEGDATNHIELPNQVARHIYIANTLSNIIISEEGDGGVAKVLGECQRLLSDDQDADLTIVENFTDYELTEEKLRELLQDAGFEARFFRPGDPVPEDIDYIKHPTPGDGYYCVARKTKTR